MRVTTSHEIVLKERFLRAGAEREVFEDEVAGEEIWVLNLGEEGAGKFEAAVGEGEEEELAGDEGVGGEDAGSNGVGDELVKPLGVEISAAYF
ncbi:hypothetical protein ACFX2A_015340 [Malus domestica]